MILKCEDCGGFLKLDGNVCICSKCGKTFSLDDEQEDIREYENIKEESDGKSDKKLIVILLAVVVLVFGFGYYFVNSTLNSTADRNEEMVNLINSTCFDEYNGTINFKGYTFGDVVNVFYNLNPEYNKIKFSCNDDIPLYYSLNEDILNFNGRKLDYVRCSLNWTSPIDSSINERFDIMFSIDKKTDEIMPVATSTDGVEWIYSEYPSDVITAYYMILGTSLDMAGVETEDLLYN